MLLIVSFHVLTKRFTRMGQKTRSSPWRHCTVISAKLRPHCRQHHPRAMALTSVGKRQAKQCRPWFESATASSLLRSWPNSSIESAWLTWGECATHDGPPHEHHPRAMALTSVGKRQAKQCHPRFESATASSLLRSWPNSSIESAYDGPPHDNVLLLAIKPSAQGSIHSLRSIFVAQQCSPLKGSVLESECYGCIRAVLDTTVCK